MRRLWVQLSFGFSIVVIMTALIFLGIAVIYAESSQDVVPAPATPADYDRLIYDEIGLISQLEDYLATADSTPEGVALRIASFLLQPQPPQYRIHLQLLTNDRMPIFGELSRRNSQNVQEIIIEDLILLYELVPNNRPTPEGRIIPPNIILIIMSLSGIGMGLIFGIIFSQRIALPLSKLAEFARQVGRREFSLRLNPEGTQEMRDVAVAFNMMTSQLEKSERLRSNLIADVSHELRTPLSVMGGSLRALIDGVSPLTKTEVLILYDQTIHLEHLISDLHELALVEASELPFNKEVVDVLTILEPIAHIFKSLADLEHIEFKTDFQTIHAFIMVDPLRIRQIVQNLLANALRHTSENGCITLCAKYKETSVIIAVSDTGEGIPSAHVPYVFERFYRVDESRDRSTGGSGLGLAIAKSIVEAHQGTLSVTSRTIQPSGTTFIIQLPIADKVSQT
ncbi:MAG: ATP-binding protein [Phototrophicaceae bacterium]